MELKERTSDNGWVTLYDGIKAVTVLKDTIKKVKTLTEFEYCYLTIESLSFSNHIGFRYDAKEEKDDFIENYNNAIGALRGE